MLPILNNLQVVQNKFGIIFLLINKLIFFFFFGRQQATIAHIKKLTFINGMIHIHKIYTTVEILQHQRD